MYGTIDCYTVFDITNTGVTSTRNNTPKLQTERNCQRNFDTVIQIISLRAQPLEIATPKKHGSNTNNWFGDHYRSISHFWHFSFEVDRSGVFADADQAFGALLDDAQHVPMLIGLSEDRTLVTQPYLVSRGDFANIHFCSLNT